MRFRGLVLLLLFVCCAVVPAYAREVAKLEPVVVTAGRVEEKPKSVTQAVTVIAQEEIAKSQYQDLGGLLRNYGVQIDNFGPNSGLSTITMRGIRSSAMGSDLQGGVLVLVDGRRVGTSNVSMIPMVNVDRIEIVRGPASVQYGTSAIGGVINIITKRGSKTPSAMVEAGYGSWDTTRAQGEGAWAYGPMDFSGGLSYYKANDYKTGDDTRYYNTGLNNKTGYSFNTGYNFFEEHRIGFVAQGVNGHDMGSPDALYLNNETAYTNRSNNSVDLVYDGGIKDAGLGWKARYYHGNSYYRNADPQDMWGFAYYRSQTEFQGAQGQLSYNKSFLTLTGGLDWMKYVTRTDTEYYPVNEHSTYDNMGVFLLAKLAFFKDTLIFSGGMRYDNYNLKVTEQNTDFDHTTPSVGVAWSPLDWLTLRANYGEAYRIADTQAMLGFNTGWRRYVGNPSLKPEEGKGWDAGFAVNYKSLDFGLTYFQTDYQNKIVSMSISPGVDEFQNMDGTVKYRGLEGQTGYDIGQAFNWPFKLRPYVNLTYLFKREDEEGRAVPNVSNMDLAYGLNFAYPDIGLDVDLRATYYGHRKEQDFNMASSTYYDYVKEGGETVVDLFVAQTLFQKEGVGKVSLRGEVRNLFDVNYAYVKDYPQPGRSFWLALRYEY